MIDKTSILDAHVQHELGRWSGDSLRQAVREEVSALFEWAQSVLLSELVDRDEVKGWIRRYASELPLSDALLRTVDRGVQTVHEALLAEEATLSDLLPRESYEELAETVIGMRELREEITTQLTTNSAYSKLVSHVLYHGIKSYLLTQNLVARKVPGASSLLRLGHNALSSAAPSLERGIDRQLVGFINLTIQDTIRESRRYLDTILDDQLMWTVAEEVWASNAERPVADAAGRVHASAVQELVESGRGVWLHLRATPFFARMAEVVVDDFFSTHADATLAGLLDEIGITEEMVIREVGPAAERIVEAARRSGHLEARIRARLDAFYSGYFAGAEPAPSPPSPRKRRTPRPRA